MSHFELFACITLFWAMIPIVSRRKRSEESSVSDGVATIIAIIICFGLIWIVAGALLEPVNRWLYPQ